jgi:hypothetical protein
VKHLTPEQIAKFAKLAKEREQEGLRKKRKRRHRFLKSEEVEQIQDAFRKTYNVSLPRHKDRIPILIPEQLSLRDNHQETIDAVRMLRDTVLIGRRPTYLCFDKVRILEPAATLLLVAEIFRCRQLRKWRGGETVIGNYPLTSEPFFQLREMGFYRLLSVDEQNSIPDGRPLGKDVLSSFAFVR